MSTLSVDTIQGQTVAGTVKLPAGYIVQAKSHSWSNEQNTTSTSFVDVNQASMTFTPKYSNSTIVVQALMHVRWDNGTSNGGGCRIMYNGSSIFDNQGYANYDDHNSNTYQSYAIAGFVTSGTTSAVTIKLQAKLYNTGNFWVNWGGNFQSNMTVMEIAQ